MNQRFMARQRILAAFDGPRPTYSGRMARVWGGRMLKDAGGHDAGGDDSPPDISNDNVDNTDSEDEDDDETDDTEDDDASGKKDKNGKGAKDETDDDEDETVPKWKLDKVTNRMKAADQRATNLQKQLDDLKSNADIPAELKKELEDTKGRVTAAETERDKANEQVRSLSIKLAALGMPKAPEWEDADVALSLADLSDVDISDDGKVDKRALKSALTALAKEKPYLVKKRTTDGNEPGSGSSGSPMNGRRKGERGTTSKDDLAKRFPALNRT